MKDAYRWLRRWRDRIWMTLSGMACMLLSHSTLSQAQGEAAAADQQVFNNACRTCHTLRDGDNRQGPNLYRVFGRKAGSLPDYNYSSAMMGAGFVWDKEKLDRFIANPDEVLPGHNMKPFSGLASADERAKVLSVLQASGL